MLTKSGHGIAAYVLLLLGLCHWLAARRLAGAELAGAEPTAEPD